MEIRNVANECKLCSNRVIAGIPLDPIANFGNIDLAWPNVTFSTGMLQVGLLHNIPTRRTAQLPELVCQKRPRIPLAISPKRAFYESSNSQHCCLNWYATKADFTVSERFLEKAAIMRICLTLEGSHLKDIYMLPQLPWKILAVALVALSVYVHRITISTAYAPFVQYTR